MIKKLVNQAFLYIIIAAMLGSSVPVFAKIALQSFDSFTLVFLRFFFASLCMLPLVVKQLRFDKQKLQQLALVGAIGSLNPILLFIALKLTQASVAPLIYAIVPALTALYLYISSNQQLSQKKILGIIVGLLGVIFVVLEPLISKDSNPGSLLGNGLIFAAALGFMGYGILSKKIKGTSPQELTFSVVVMTLLLSMPLALWEINQFGLPESSTLSGWGAALFIGVGGTAVFYLLYQKALVMGNEISASLFFYLQPIFTAGMAILFLGEHITPILIVGGLLSILGARLASK